MAIAISATYEYGGLLKLLEDEFEVLDAVEDDGCGWGELHEEVLGARGSSLESTGVWGPDVVVPASAVLEIAANVVTGDIAEIKKNCVKVIKFLTK